jgi:hypothetical protein
MSWLAPASCRAISAWPAKTTAPQSPKIPIVTAKRSILRAIVLSGP